MKEVVIGKQAAIKLRKGVSELFVSDLEKSVSGIYPGQFLLLVDEVKQVKYMSHCYSLDKKYPLFKVHGLSDIHDPEEYISTALKKAVSYRENFRHYDGNMRLVFGQADNLPGLIIDSYQNTICITVSSCAYDSFLKLICSYLNEFYPTKKVYVSGKNNERLKFGQPQLEFDSVLEEIEAMENGVKFLIKPEVFQKNGFYFDHRENRTRAINTIKNLNGEYKTGLDLFSYLGAWGLSFLKEDLCQNIKFVDQADLASSFDINLSLNGLSSRGSFLREDVFEYLNKEISQGSKYDLICCDPPAFAKSMSAKKSALVGYKKLHTMNLKLLNPGGIYISASCTHYVTMDEFQAGVFECAQNLGKNIRMLDIGIQSGDHKFSHFASKQNYIKYFLYLVE